MNIGDLRKAIKHLDDELTIVVHAPIEDEDGDMIEHFFSMTTVTRDMEPDTAEWYAKVACTAIEDAWPITDE